MIRGWRGGWGRLVLLPLVVLLAACGAVRLDQIYSLDHRHHVELVFTGRGQEVWRDGRALARHAAVDPDTLRLSEDGRHVAYAARARGGWIMVLDGAASARWDAVLPGSVRLGAAGHLAYAALRGGAAFVAAGSQVYGPCDGVAALQVDRDAAHVAFICRRGAAAWAVLDGREDGPHEALAELLLGPHGGRLATIARRAGRWRVTVDGVAQAHESAAGLRFSESGAHYIYVAREGGREHVVHDGTAGPAFDRVLWRTLALGEDGAVPVYVAEEGGRQRAVQGTGPGPPYDRIRGLRVAGGRVGYIGVLGRREQAVIDGVPAQWFDEVADLALSEAGTGHAYLARRGKALRLVSAGRELPLTWALAGSLALCPDGRHVGLLGSVTPGARQLLLDGRALRAFDQEEQEAVSRAWGAAGLRRWVATEIGPACGSR